MEILLEPTSNKLMVGPTVDLDLLVYPLCESQKDSHEHLFFECSFSLQVWNNIHHLARMKQEQPVLHDIVNYLQPMANNRMASNIIGRIILAASSYYIWLERNIRIFKKGKKSPNEIKDTIMVMVRLKLLTFKFKNTAKGLNPPPHRLKQDEAYPFQEEVRRTLTKYAALSADFPPAEFVSKSNPKT
uniref:Reverse transcriptase domain, reverse transcriptase zinc-binding domain protein n=1 Tax=Tanacetum cinerariifolium TaxID=118510 RepID=A0A6L2JNJ4_TANCI|nr:hypothetical protein [Tanacetum cinerariifolium]